MPGASHLALIRPFLNLTRGQIDSYCRENDLHPRLDHTNLDSSLLRNRIRLEMLPALRQLNPQITRALMQLAEAASLDDQYLQQALEQAVANHLTYTSERIAVQRAVFQDLQPALQRRCIAWAARQLGAADVGYEPIVAAVSLALSGQVGSRALLGSGVSLRIDYDQVVIERKTAQRDKDDWPLLHLENAIEVDAPGVTTIPGLPWQLRASFSPLEADGRLTISTASRLWLRTRRPGDRFAPLGLHGHSQSVKEWMIDHKVPRAVRDQIPLLLVDDRIAALIVGEKWIVSEPFAAREDSQHILYLSFLHNET